MSELETTIMMILQMGKQRLERGSDSVNVTRAVGGRFKTVTPQWVGPSWHLCPLASYSEQVSQWEQIPWASKSSEPHLEGRGPLLPETSIWASEEGWQNGFRVGVLPAHFQAAASPASSPRPVGACYSSWQPHPPNIWLGWTGLD